MPWKEICTVELREELGSAMLAGEVGVADLCRRAAVSRKTVYKWRERYQALGRAGLADRSRARLTQPDAVSDDVLDAILSTRLEHPTWGVKKILPYLSRMDPGLELPCLSTASEILRRAGLTSPQKKARRRPGPHNKSQEADTPNATWTIDFKGQFRLGCRSLCYPLTVADRFSRYLLCVDAKPGTQLSGVVTSMKRLFAVYGLPQRIKSDNGSPFAGSGLARLSRLSVWFMSLGIEVEHITPGKPGENGRHERMHRTLKAETACPPAWSMRGQQRRFNGFREEYNEDRPHEAIGQQPPASVYVPSSSVYLGDREEQDPYPGHWERRRVRTDGTIRWRGEHRYLSEPLSGRLVGLVETDEDFWEVHYCQTLIGVLDGRDGEVRVRDPLDALATPD